jgi:hypothetical protein
MSPANFELKEKAIAMRQSGMSMTVIEQKLGVARSTLSGWFKTVQLTDEQRLRLKKNSLDGWTKARVRAVESHRAQKELRLLTAKQEAQKILDKIELSDETLELAFAMLYLGEGAKNGRTSIASSDPKILKFVLAVLKRNYQITPSMVRCELHLRADQESQASIQYWSDTLGIPVQQFRGVFHDQRTIGRPTYDHYKGVCVLYCGSIAIQRKLVYLYNLFCERVAALEMGD